MPVADALAAVIASARLTPAASVAIDDAAGMTLSRPLHALRSQPPLDVSAMDGYAVRAADLASGSTLKLIGESAAGHAFAGRVQAGEAVRIFTGAAIPDGADTVLLQENAERNGDAVSARQGELAGRHIRRKGLDFAAGALGLPSGHRLDERSIALAAAMGHGHLPVQKSPRIGILATGDELVPPGVTPSGDQIIASNHLTTAAIIRQAGGEPMQLGIAGDSFSSLEAAIRNAKLAGLDALVTLGGASVGDHDLVQSALAKEGLELGFWKIAMRPGKPMIFGRLGEMAILGLPGNPVSSFVCATLFLAPLIRAMLGDPEAAADRSEPGVLGKDLPANDQRMDFLRSRMDAAGPTARITPYDIQDSSMIGIMAASTALLIRQPFAAVAHAGDLCRFLRL